jgi:hypothetical protein
METSTYADETSLDVLHTVLLLMMMTYPVLYCHFMCINSETYQHYATTPIINTAVAQALQSNNVALVTNAKNLNLVITFCSHHFSQLLFKPQTSDPHYSMGTANTFYSYTVFPLTLFAAVPFSVPHIKHIIFLCSVFYVRFSCKVQVQKVG